MFNNDINNLRRRLKKKSIPKIIILILYILYILITIRYIQKNGIEYFVTELIQSNGIKLIIGFLLISAFVIYILIILIRNIYLINVPNKHKNFKKFNYSMDLINKILEEINSQQEFVAYDTTFSKDYLKYTKKNDLKIMKYIEVKQIILSVEYKKDTVFVVTLQDNFNDQINIECFGATDDQINKFLLYLKGKCPNAYEINTM